MRKILLDTNAYVRYISGDDTAFSQIVEADVIYLSPIVIGELIAGFYGGSQFKRNRDVLKKFISKSTVEVLTVGTETAEIFGEVKNELKINGTPIPVNDIWIAANAIETGAVLVSYDRHFLKVRGLRLWQDIKNL